MIQMEAQRLIKKFIMIKREKQKFLKAILNIGD